MEDIRWKQRFQNFENAFKRLKQAIDAHKTEPGNDLFQMALIQAFEFTFELGWKTMKDFLREQGIKTNFPREAIKEAFATDIIEDGQAWIDMIDERNLTSYAYSEELAKKAINNIVYKYFSAIEQVYEYFKEKL